MLLLKFRPTVLFQTLQDRMVVVERAHTVMTLSPSLVPEPVRPVCNGIQPAVRKSSWMLEAHGAAGAGLTSASTPDVDYC